MNKKINNKVIEAIHEELNSEKNLELLAKNNKGRNYVISAAAGNDVNLKGKFFTGRKLRITTVAMLYSLFFFFLMLSFAYISSKNISTAIRSEVNMYHLSISVVISAIFLWIGIFPVYWLKMDRKNPVDVQTVGYHLANVLPLFLIPISFLFRPITNNKDIEFHTMIFSLVILLQGIVLSSTMFFANLSTKKRFPILSKKTIKFWSIYLILFFLPLVYWLLTNVINLGGAESNTTSLYLILAFLIISSGFLVWLAIFISNKHFIFHDKLISNTSQVILTMVYYMLGGSIAGMGISFIDFKVPFAFTTSLIFAILISVALIGSYFGLVLKDYLIVGSKKRDAIVNSFVFNAFVFTQIIIMVLFTLFTPSKTSQFRPEYPYYIMLLGITIFFMCLINTIFNVNLFILNILPKVISIFILVFLTGMVGVIVSSLRESAVVKTIYALDLSMIALLIILLLFSIVVMINIFVLVWKRAIIKTNLRKSEKLKDTEYKKEFQKELDKPQVST